MKLRGDMLGWQPADYERALVAEVRRIAAEEERPSGSGALLRYRHLGAETVGAFPETALVVTLEDRVSGEVVTETVRIWSDDRMWFERNPGEVVIVDPVDVVGDLFL